MKNFLYNLDYFFKEARTIFRVDLLSNILSIFSIGLIFFILSMIFSGWWISNEIVEVLQKEAEINVYFDEKIEDSKIMKLVSDIENIEGVREVVLVNREESYDRMVDILGKEAHMLELFETNPFSSFIETKIQIGDIDIVLERLEKLDNIEHIRDNKQVIDRLENIISILTVLGILIVVAVGISTLIVISHIIRQGIYNNREQISTLKLLGAPDSFIGFPFLMEGLFLTILGGLIGSTLIGFTIYYGIGQMGVDLPFVPLPDSKKLVHSVIFLIMSLSCGLGIMGSIFGLMSAKDNQ